MINSIMEFMVRDHGRLDRIFTKFRSMKNTDMAGAKILFDDFMQGLRRHILWEEEILFPVFGKKTGTGRGGPVAVMHMEHRQISHYLDQIYRNISVGEMAGVDEQITALLDVLAGHNWKEENILYPWIDRETSEKERENILARMKK